MVEPKADRVVFKKRSVSLREDQWIELERYAIEDAKHGMVSRALQDAVDAWKTARRPESQRQAAAS